MKKLKIIFIIIITILTIIIINFYKSKNIKINDYFIFSLWDFKKDEKEYILNLEEEILQINIFQTSENNTYNKVAPGSKGRFTIKLINSVGKEFEIQLKDTLGKPNNLVFIIEDERYYSLSELENIISDKLHKDSNVIINWEWKYEENIISDIEDTEDGQNAQKYYFEINVIT